MQVFFSRDDYHSYVGLLALQASRHSLEIWAYCLMPNHVHLIAVPSTEQGLAKPLAEEHRRYAVLVNRRHGWTGHLWQERFSSFPMDEPHLMAAIRYVLLNPVRAGLVETATAWPHSSARAQILGRPDKLVNVGPVADRVSDWDAFLGLEPDSTEYDVLRRHGRIGRPLGSDGFVEGLERLTGRRLRPRKAGRRPKAK